MSWEYRVVEQYIPGATGTYLEIQEVYYDKKGNINGFGQAPVPYGETTEDIKEVLKLMLKATEKEIVIKPLGD